MKKLAVLFMFLVIGVWNMHAVEPSFQKDDKVVNATIGFGGYNFSGLYSSTLVPPVAISVEKGIKENFLDVENMTLGLGGYLGFSSNKWEYNYFGGQWGYKYKNIILGGRGAVHYPLVDKLDTYAGLMLGVNIVTAKEYGTSTGGVNYSANGSGIAYFWFAGARYYINDKFALLGELGYGIAYLNLGLAIKL